MEIPHKNLEIWKQIGILNSPIVNGHEPASTKEGDYLLIADNAVWLQHTPSDPFSTEPIFAKAVYAVEFVRMNPKIFEKLA